MNDNSKEILNNYVSANKPLKITLKSGHVLTGRLVSFFHGDSEAKEPYIIKWHFVSERDLEKYRIMPFSDNAEVGTILLQKDILDVSFASE